MASQSVLRMLISVARNRNLGPVGSPRPKDGKCQNRRSSPQPRGEHPQKKGTPNSLPQYDGHPLKQQKRPEDRRESHGPSVPTILAPALHPNPTVYLLGTF